MYFRYVEVSSSTDILTVNIHFTDLYIDHHSFENFLDLWSFFYDSERPFRFIIHTSDIKEIPSLWLSLRMAWFIYTMKLRYPVYHYLRESHIIVENAILRRLLEFVFSVQAPVSPVYIYTGEEYTPGMTPDTVITPNDV